MNLPQYLGAMALLAALLALLVGGATLLRRSKLLDRLRETLKLPGRTLTVVSSVGLDAKTRLVVVQDGEREHLLLVGHGQLLETRAARVAEAA